MDETDIIHKELVEISFDEAGFSVYYDKDENVWYAESHDPEEDEIIEFVESSFEGEGFSIFGHLFQKEDFLKWKELTLD